jgi:hypothetical protein
MRLVASLTLCVLGLAACKKEDQAPPRPAQKFEQPPTATATTAALLGPNGPNYVATLKPRLEAEAKSRPTGTPRAEDVFEALKKAGIESTPAQQVLGAMVHAVYCVSTATPDGALGISICEYASEGAAEEGKTFSLETFKTFQNRSIARNKKTTLTLQRVLPGDAVDRAAKKATEIFSAL